MRRTERSPPGRLVASPAGNRPEGAMDRASAWRPDTEPTNRPPADNAAFPPLTAARARAAPARKQGQGAVLPVKPGAVRPMVDMILERWIGEAPPGEEAGRKRVADLINNLRATRAKDLHIAGIRLGSLPPCLDRLSLKTLTVMDCGLTCLPALPARLNELHVTRNQLQTLPTLPVTLLKVDASANQLAGLPALPRNLVDVNVRNNRLQILPALPSTLKRLDVSGNQLQRLPVLTDWLENLNVSMNPQLGLDQLPAALQILEACHCDLAQLPTLPAALMSLHASGNRMAFLPPLPAAITHLDISHNRLVALPPLPTSLRQIGARSNQLAHLPAIPQALVTLDAADNCLSDLPPSLMQAIGLTNVDLRRNRLSAMQLGELMREMQKQGKNLSHIHLDAASDTSVAVPEQAEPAPADEVELPVTVLQKAPSVAASDELSSWLVLDDHGCTPEAEHIEDWERIAPDSVRPS